MKRLQAIMAVLVTLFLLSITAAAGVGDVNGDGVVDLKDVTHLRRALAGGYGASVDDMAGDVNLDGTTDLKDVTYLRRYLAGGYDVELIEPNVEDIKFSVLRDVFYDDGYYANILTVDEGMTTLPLSDAQGNELYAKYKAEVSGGTAVYNYGIVSYCHKSGDYYKLKLDCLPTNYSDIELITVDKGVDFSYNQSISYATVGEYEKVLVRNYDNVFVVTGANKNKLEECDVYNYPRSEVAKTVSTALITRNTNNRLTLLCVVIDELPGPDYRYDGRAINLAYRDSTVQKVDSTKYNKYFFLNLQTLKTGAVTDLENVYDSVTNPGAVEGGLYGYDINLHNYVQITSKKSVDSIRVSRVVDVMTNFDLLETYDSMVAIDSDVKIWGLSDPSYSSKTKILTIDELGEMFKAVNASNKKYGTNETISVALVYIQNGRGYSLHSIIVEIYEFDSEGKATSVNDVIFKQYYGN